MLIECVICCVNYSDFLAHSLPFNKNFFNRTVVVTSLDDKDTKRVCDFYNVECVQTNEWFSDDAPFNKGRGINVGLSKLSRSDWVVHMDADIVLPPRSREIIERKRLDDSCIYGLDRFLVPSYKVWSEFVAKPKLQHELDVYLHTDTFPIGTRIVKISEGGIVNIGFFQLWNARKSGVVVYPVEHQDAARSDMLFALQWPANKRQFISELIVYHLATEDYTNCEMGVNWAGRKTQIFGPSELTKGLPTPPKHSIGYRDALRRIIT